MVTLTIRNVDESIVERLRERAALNHRSLQGESLAIIEEQVLAKPRLTPTDLVKEVRRRGLRTPREAVKMIRAHRDAR